MDPEKMTETTRYARMLYQAVLSLKPGELAPVRQVHRMARAIAIVEVMAARSHSQHPH
jgi:hypothetical protein